MGELDEAERHNWILFRGLIREEEIAKCHKNHALSRKWSA